MQTINYFLISKENFRILFKKVSRRIPKYIVLRVIPC